MNKSITALLKKAIISLLSAAFIAAMLVPAVAAVKSSSTYTKNGKVYRSTTKRHHKAKHVQKAWPASKSNKVKYYRNTKMGDRSNDRSESTLERGVTTSAGKAVKFTKRTLTVPQKNPNAAPKKTDRSKSTLERGVNTSAHKAGKFLKRTFTAPKK